MRTDELFNAIQVWNKTYVS